MFNLDLPTKRYWLDLPLSVRIEVLPLDGMMAAVARHHAAARVAAIAKERAERIETGVAVDDLPDIADPAIRGGLLQMELAAALARAGALDWEGVGDADGNALPFTKAGAERLARHPVMSEPFITRYFEPLERVNAEGNASAPAPNGSTAPGANTATAAASDARTAHPSSTRHSRRKAARSGKRPQPA